LIVVIHKGEKMLLRFHTNRYLLLLGVATLLLLGGLLMALPAQAQEPDANPAPRLFLPVVVGGSNVVRQGDVIPGQYIVVLKDAGVRAAAGQAETEAALADRMAATYGGEVLFVYDAALSGFAIRVADEAAELIAADANVAYVEQDSVAGIPEPAGFAATDATEGLAGELSPAATDAFTQTSAVWGLDRIDQRLLPLNSQYVYLVRSADVHAYIIDTGILNTHTQFTGRIGNGFTAIADGNGSVDCNGHGSHVAGTVGGTTYGVAKKVMLHPVRVLGCTGSGSNSGVIAGVNWVTANHVKPAVANMSLGGGLSFALRTAVERSIKAGVVYVVAAGNSDDNACLYSPASVPAAITVGATDKTDTRASFSNWGNCVDVFAPGVGIKSAWYTSTTATNIIDGTSMASPHVAGVVALYLQSNQAATPAQAAAWVVSQATPGIILNPMTGSPNLLLYNGLPAPAPVACTNKVANPGFESGVASWSRSSTNALTLICTAAGCTGAPAPHTGSYLAWLGRDTNSETSTVTNSTAMVLPAGVSARLSFWYAIDSEESSCTFDYGYVRVTADGLTSTIKTFPLCYENTSSTWERMQINLSAYAGKTITLAFRAANDGSAPSSFYIDDVQVVSGASCTLLAAEEGAVVEPENGSGEDITPAPRP
jgi:subtilisin family serine protease